MGLSQLDTEAQRHVILINAISITEGGGLVVLNRMLDQFASAWPHTNWHVATDPAVAALLPMHQNIIPETYGWAKKSPLHRAYWYEFALPRLVKRIRAQLCFSHTNFLPKRRLSCRTLLLVQHAGYFSEKFIELFYRWNVNKPLHQFFWRQKRNWLKQSIQHASHVTVQTKALADKIVKQTKFDSQNISVIPHGAGLLEQTLTAPRLYPVTTEWRIGYITKFGVQKNFDTLFAAISQLKQSGLTVKLILTIGQENPEYTHLYQLIKQYDIESQIENHGEISDAQGIQSLYDSLHCFVFPSLCESFGFTLVEAITRGLPCVVADTDSNQEVAGIAGRYFSAEDSSDLAHKLKSLISDQAMYEKCSINSLARAQDFSWQKTANNLLELMQKIMR